MSTQYDFDAITLEVYIEEDGAWTDLTPDVLWAYGIKGSRGVLSNRVTERIGGVGELTFTLKGGKYVPQAAYSLGDFVWLNWRQGQIVRLTFEYDGYRVRKWMGYIESIQPIDFTVLRTGTPMVEVKCKDYMGIMADTILDLMQIQVNKTISEAVAVLLTSMPFAPQETDYATGAYTYTTVFDAMNGDTTALSEANKLANSEWSYIYAKGGGATGEVLQVEDQNTRSYLAVDTVPTYSADTSTLLINNAGDHLLINSAGDRLLLRGGTATNAVFDTSDYSAADPPEVEFGADIYNYFKWTAYPRQLGGTATTVLWTLQEPLRIPAGETISGIRGRYRDQASGSTKINGMDFVDPPVAGTDYKAFANANGTGGTLTANLSVTATFGSAEVEFSLTNTGGTALYTGGTAIPFQVRGRPIYLFDTAELVSSSTASISKYGKRSLLFDMKYQTDAAAVQAVQIKFVERIKNPRYSIEKWTVFANKDPDNIFKFMFLEPGSAVTVNYSTAFSSYLIPGIDGTFIVNGYTFEVYGKKKVRWTPILIDQYLNIV